jgi:release factor glutamine methyltransferase
MTIQDCLKYGSEKLSGVGIETSRLDTLILLEDVTGNAKAWILANLDIDLSDSQMKKIKKLLNLRSDHTPLAYVRGSVEFYGRNYVVNKHVLVPRPESETMIDLLKSLFKTSVHDPKGHLQTTKTYNIGDVGCGSGALGITVQLELPGHRIELIDVDPKALIVAKINVDKFTLNIRTIRSDLLSDVQTSYDILLCNLPYVPDDFQINLAASHEPDLAIYGGSDGLNVYRQLFNQLRDMNLRPLYILCESLPIQHTELNRIAQQCGYRQQIEEDFIQVFGLNKI